MLVHWRYENWANGMLAAYLADQKDIFALLFEAAEKPAFRIQVDWDQRNRPEFPELEQMRSLSRQLCWDAELRTERGDWQGAIRCLRTARRVAWMASQVPNEFGQFRAVEIDSKALLSVGTCASGMAGNARALDALRKAVEETNWEPSIDQGYRGGLYRWIVFYRNRGDVEIFNLARREYIIQDVQNPSPPLVRAGLPKTPMARAVAAEVMAYWNEFWPRFKGGKEDEKTLGPDMDARRQALYSSRSASERTASTTLGANVPGFFHITKMRRSQEATATAYIGVLQYKVKHGCWPATLKEAGVDFVDALTEKPLGYRIDPKSVRVWNAGDNNRDDNGVSLSEANVALHGRSLPPYDHVFIYPNPPRSQNSAF
jgi:hypothetical protein